MSLKPPEPRAGHVWARRGGPMQLFWVIGGCYGDESGSWRRWSEVLGPFATREAAEAQRRRMRGIFHADPRVHFEVVTQPAL